MKTQTTIPRPRAPRPATRLLLTLVALSALVLALPATSEAWDYRSPLYDYETSSYNGSYIYAYLNSNLLYGSGWFLTSYDKVKGRHAVAWMGYSPYNADQLRFGGEWYFAGIGASVSAGTGGAGVGLTIDGNTATFSDECTNCWQLQHDFTGISPAGVIYYRSESVNGSFRFGSRWVSVSAYDYDYM